MLTEEQKIKLEPLTQHPKYGQLLTDAMKTWEFTTPKKQTSGITKFKINLKKESIQIGQWKLDTADDNCCCLVGAFLLGKDSTEDMIGSASNAMNISRIEVWKLIDGFDETISLSDTKSETYQFAKSVSQCLFGEK